MDWERHARRILAQLRADYAERGGSGTPDERRLAELIGQLRAEFPEADGWLDEHQVQDRTGMAKDIQHRRAPGAARPRLRLTETPEGPYASLRTGPQRSSGQRAGRRWRPVP